MIFYNSNVFCNMEGCRNADFDRYISDAEKNLAAEHELPVAYAEYWRQCITYDEVKEART